MSQLRRVILGVSLVVAISGLAWFVIWVWGLNRSDGIAVASLAVGAGSLLVGIGTWLFPVSGSGQSPKHEVSGDRSIGIATDNDAVATGDDNVFKSSVDGSKKPGAAPPSRDMRVTGSRSVGFATGNGVVITGDRNQVRLSRSRRGTGKQ